MSFPDNTQQHSAVPYVAGPTSPAPVSPPAYPPYGYQQTGPQQFVPQQYGPPSGGFRTPIPPKKKRSVLAIVLWCVLGALVLVVGIGVIGALAATTAKKPTAATQTTAPANAVQHCDHGHLADGSCASGNEPTDMNAAYLDAVRPLNFTTDDKMLELGNAMCSVLDRTGGDVDQVVNVESTVPKASILTVVQAAGRYLCPQWMTVTQAYVLPAAPAKPANSIDDGTWTVGEDFPAGTYKTTGSGEDCYWSIYKSGTNQSDIVNNHIGGGNLRVTLKKGQDFETARCGTWTKVK